MLLARQTDRQQVAAMKNWIPENDAAAFSAKKLDIS